MNSTNDIVEYIKEFGGVFRFGSGVLGKSAIGVGILMIAVAIASWRLHSDWMIIAALLIGTAAFLIWFFFVLNFSEKHPDIAMLEGAEWSSYQRFQASAKGYLPTAQDQEVELSPGTQIQINVEPKQESDKET